MWPFKLPEVGRGWGVQTKTQAETEQDQREGFQHAEGGLGYHMHRKWG